MKVKLNDILVAKESFEVIMKEKLPVKVSYRINKLVKGPMARELATYNEEHRKLVIEYGVQKEDGSWKVEDPEKVDAFGVKFNELIDIEVDLGEFELVDVEELGDVKLEPKHIIPWLFK